MKRKKIKNWLKENSVYEGFISNIIRTCRWDDSEISSGKIYDIITDTISGRIGQNMIVVAFNWEHSKEGFSFWRDIDGRFREWYESNYTIKGIATKVCRKIKNTFKSK